MGAWRLVEAAEWTVEGLKSEALSEGVVVIIFDVVVVVVVVTTFC